MLWAGIEIGESGEVNSIGEWRWEWLLPVARACNAERSTTQPQVSDSADLAINKTDYSQSTNTYTLLRWTRRDSFTGFLQLSMRFHGEIANSVRSALIRIELQPDFLLCDVSMKEKLKDNKWTKQIYLIKEREKEICKTLIFIKSKII